MKKLKLSVLILLSLVLLSCEKESNESNNAPFVVEGLTTDNYPIIDGSTSTDPLNRLIACKLLGFDYKWEQMLHMDGSWYLSTSFPGDFMEKHIRSSQTHNAFINLIDEKADIILSARKMSEDEKEYARNAGVSLIETPIALDAFVFIMNKNSPIKSLTTKQAQDIYTGKITNWKDVGGSNNTITPYIRNPNSGSQELMETIVMKGLEIPDWEISWAPDLMIPTMSLVFSELRGNINGLCYTVYYYKEQIMRNEAIKSLAINGISPNKTNISNKSYPYTAEIYAVIRSELDRQSMAYKIYELLQTKSGKDVISESGYVPN